MRRRDPRSDPQRGDVLDDDPPLPPIRVVERYPAAVYGLRTHPGGPIRWHGSLAQWREEMAGADVLRRGDP